MFYFSSSQKEKQQLLTTNFSHILGKYYHRSRRNRDCVYTTDLAYHLAEKAKTEAAALVTKAQQAKDRALRNEQRPDRSTPGTPNNRRNRSSPPEATSHQGTEDDSVDESDTSNEDSPEVRRGRRQGGSPDLPFVGSPGSDISSLSSASPPPLARYLDTVVRPPPPPAVKATQLPPPSSALVHLFFPFTADEFRAELTQLEMCRNHYSG